MIIFYSNYIMDYYDKYHKYKSKYLKLKYEAYQIGGNNKELNLKFAINIYDNLDGASNLISPLSVIYFISLFHLIALGNTSDQLTKVLGHKYNIEELSRFYQILNNDFIKMITFILVNGNEINQEYFKLTRNLALVKKKDFHDADLIALKINKYIGKNTNGIIKNIISAEDIKNNMCIIVINAIYFEIIWKYKFNTNETTKLRFHKTDMVDMMHQVNYFDYYENQLIQMIEIPISNVHYTMGIILPKKYLEQSELDYSVNNTPKFTPEEIMGFINNRESRLLDVYIPKFTHIKRLDMIPIFVKMGITDLFNKENVHLNITSGNSYLSKIIHESVIIVNESGIEEPNIPIFGISGEIPTLFRADHAFIYYIRYIPLNLFLFYGDYQGS